MMSVGPGENGSPCGGGCWLLARGTVGSRRWWELLFTRPPPRGGVVYMGWVDTLIAVLGNE